MGFFFPKERVYSLRDKVQPYSLHSAQNFRGFRYRLAP